MNIEQIEYAPALLGYELEVIRNQIQRGLRRRNEMEAKQLEAVKRRKAEQRAAEYAQVWEMSA